MNQHHLLIIIFVINTLLLLLPTIVHSDCGCGGKKLKRDSASIEQRYARSASASSADGRCPAGSTVDETGECRSSSAAANEGNTDEVDTTFKKLIKDHAAPPADADAEQTTMTLIPGGHMTIGTKRAIFPEDNESPPRQMQIKDFLLDIYETSNANFRDFVLATGRKTDAEKFGDSFVFKGLISEEMQQKYVDFRVASAVWWYKIDKVDWMHPEGPDSNLNGTVPLLML